MLREPLKVRNVKIKVDSFYVYTYKNRSVKAKNKTLTFKYVFPMCTRRLLNFKNILKKF